MFTIELPKDAPKILQYGNQTVIYFRFDPKETKEDTIIYNEATLTLKNIEYNEMVSALIGVKYSIDAQLALLYNYQNDSEAYAEDMQIYQNWRNYCKESAKEFFGL